MRHSADLESSTHLNSVAIMRHHMPHHVHVNGINGSAALYRLLKCENMLCRQKCYQAFSRSSVGLTHAQEMESSLLLCAKATLCDCLHLGVSLLNVFSLSL